MPETGDARLQRAAALVIIAVPAFVIGRALLPCLTPFALAFLTAAAVEPVVAALERLWRLRRGFASAMCVLVLLLSALGVIAYAAARLLLEAVSLLRELPELLSGTPDVFARLEARVEVYISRCPEGMLDWLRNTAERLAERAGELPAELSARTLGYISGLFQKLPAAMLGAATYLIASLFISAGYPAVRAFLLMQLPEKARRRGAALKSDILRALAGWLKAQLALSGVTFLELAVSFWLLEIPHGIVIAAGTAFIDALPVFGTGAVLIPWSAASALTGDTPLAAGLMATYLIVTLMRNLLEPKLVGSGLGVHPAAALLAIYAGFRLCGVAGMVLFPPALLVVKLLNDRGYIKLWRTEFR